MTRNAAPSPDRSAFPTPDTGPGPGIGTDTGSREDRAYLRHEWWRDVQVVWFRSASDLANEPTRFRAQNISAGGVAIRSTCMIHLGQMGVILLGRGAQEIIIRGIEVRHCRYDETLRNHILGCSWVPIPSYLEATVSGHELSSLTLVVTITKNQLGDNYQE